MSKKSKAANLKVSPKPPFMVDESKRQRDDEDDDFEGKSDADLLLRAQEIMLHPERFKKAHGHIRTKQKAVNSIADLYRIHQEKFAKEGGGKK